MDEPEQIKLRFKELIENAERMQGKTFRLALEEILKEGEDELEGVWIQYITDRNVNPDIRMDLIRAAGLTERSSFLVPLKKIIETEQHARIQQEAIIAVAKFDDRRALNILSQALQKLNNPLLLSTLNTEIARIKENNPILALIPRFQAGQKSPKTFNVTLQLLKRILNPADATIFTKFLTSEDPLIRNGAFEILCITGDIFHDADIIEYFQKNFDQIPCIHEQECEALYLLTYHFKIYLSRYLFLIEEQVPNLKLQYSKVKDIRVRQLLIALICKSKNKRTLTYLENVYKKSPDVRTTIIEELSGNETATEFLFTIYRTDPEVKEKIIQSLLNSKEGLQFFVQQFFSLPFEEQELIAKNLPYASKYNLTDFIKDIFQSKIYHLKEILMGKLKENFDFSAESILFDTEREREFFFMGDHYLDTITSLFPVSSVRRLLSKIANPELSINKARHYLGKINEVMASEIIINFKDKEYLDKLFDRIYRSHNADLNVDFLSMIKTMKTFDKTTFLNMNSCLGAYINLREMQLTPKERGELSRIKRNLVEISNELRKIEEGLAAFQQLPRMDPVDFRALSNLIKTYPLALAFFKDRFFNYLAKEFPKCTSEHVTEWIDFFTQYPRVMNVLKNVVEQKILIQDDIAYKALEDLLDNVSGSPIRVVIIFKNRQLTAVLREEFKEVDPGVTVIEYDYDLTDMDILLCDAEILRDLILQGKTMPEKIFLFMENLEGFSDFKAYNTRNFVRPFFYYRIIKDVLSELYS